MEDNEAIRETLTGNKEAFGHLVRRYHRALYYFVVGKVPLDGEAEDIVQKTFVTAYNKLSEYRTDASFLAWLRGIAVNQCRNQWKQHQRQSELKGRLIEVRRAELQMRELSENDSEPARISALRMCMETLSDHDQKVVHLRFMQQQPLEAIARDLNRTSEAVRLLLYRIRSRLSTCVKRRLVSQEAPL